MLRTKKTDESALTVEKQPSKEHKNSCLSEKDRKRRLLELIHDKSKQSKPSERSYDQSANSSSIVKKEQHIKSRDLVKVMIERRRIPDSVRKDPFTRLRPSELNLGEGVYNLVTKGYIKSDQDVTELLNANMKVVQWKKLRYADIQ